MSQGVNGTLFWGQVFSADNLGPPDVLSNHLWYILFEEIGENFAFCFSSSYSALPPKGARGGSLAKYWGNVTLGGN